MQLKDFVFICAASVLLVSSASYAADIPGDVAASPPPEAAVAPADATVSASAESAVVTASDQSSTATNPTMTTKTPPPSTSQKAMAGAAVASNQPTASPQQIYLIRDNPFFNMHIEKAVQHAREAEIAGNMGESEVLLEHARMSLMQAREAKRAGTVPGLNEGIANLKEALRLPIVLTKSSMQPSSAEVPQASMQTSSTELPQASIQTSSAEAPQASMQPSSAELPQTSTQTSSAPQVRGEKAQSETQRTDAALRSATDAVREARKNLSEAGGLKYKEIQPQAVKTVSQ